MSDYTSTTGETWVRSVSSLSPDGVLWVPARFHNLESAEILTELLALRAQRDELHTSLAETVRALQQHLHEAALAAGLKSTSELCPCQDNEVARANAILKESAKAQRP